MRNKKLVLAVFESLTICMKLKHELEKIGFDVLTSNSSIEAEKQARASFPDIIVADTFLNEKDGFDLCKSIKRNMNYSDIPFIFFSQLELPEDQTKARFYGADDFVAQSEGIEFLIVKIKKLTKDRNESILLVEDSPTQGAELKYLLEKNGFTVKLVLNGKIALKLLKAFKPKLILSDIRMPELDGIELCQAIKNDPRLSSIPVILLTSLSSPTDVIDAISAGANYYFPKSYSESYMINKISSILANENPDKEETLVPTIIDFDGKSYQITTSKEKLLKLLFSTYEIATIQNSELMKTQLELKRLNENLEETIKERTVQLLCEANEKKKIEQQLFQAQKMEAIGHLTNGIAHDFNNILQVILGYGEILMEHSTENDPCCESLSHIMHAGKQAMGLVRQLLAFSKKNEPKRVELDVTNLLENIIHLSKRMIGSHIVFETNIEKDVPSLIADPTMLEQSLLNLFINARDAMPDGGKLTINAKRLKNFETDWPELSETRPNYILLEITDNGKGMTKELQEKIFDPFFTTKSPGKGTGLGLASVYACVRKHKGYIKVRSEVNQGTTFSIILPILTSQELNQIRHRTIMQNQDLQGSEHVFLAEDNHMIRKFICKLLEKNGYKVDSEDNGESAIKCLEEKLDKYSIFILDVIMPGKTGKEVAAYIRSKNEKVPVLFCSGHTGNQLTDSYIKEINAELLEKPFAPTELLVRVKNMLKRSKTPEINFLKSIN